jgi:hypothetical protein
MCKFEGAGALTIPLGQVLLVDTKSLSRFLRRLAAQVLCFLLAWAALGACQTINQMKNFANCSFRRQDVGKFNVAGIDLGNRRSLADFGVADLATLGRAWGQPEFPITFMVNVEAKNPNPQPAAMIRMDWIAAVDGKDLVSGTLNERVDVAANGGTALVPLQVKLDLKKLFAGQERNAALGFLFDAAAKGNDNTRLALKIKPYVRVAGVDIPYPGYLTIKKDFE